MLATVPDAIGCGRGTGGAAHAGQAFYDEVHFLFALDLRLVATGAEHLPHGVVLLDALRSRRRGVPRTKHLDETDRPGLDVPLAMRQRSHVVVDEETLGRNAKHQTVSDTG